MIKYFTFLILILSINLKAQNYIYNYDFETADNNNSDWPSNVGQVDKMTSWESRTYSTSTKTIHSPDWINYNGSGTQTLWPIVPQTHSGKGMIGMSNYELIQQLFNSGNPLTGETYHTLSMWVYIPSNSPTDCRLKIMFSQNRLKYKNENILTGNQQVSDLCTQDYIDYHNLLSSYTTIHEFDFNNLNLPKDSWQKISFSFKTPPNSVLNNYDVFAMELRKNGYTPTSIAGNCSDSYIYIDDISLTKSDFCNAACAPNLGTITHGTFQNAMYVLGIPFNVIFQNAIGIELRVFDRWGAQIAFVDAFDPNGLKDIGYSDYQFLWSGADIYGNPLFPQDVYNYTLRYWNCKEDHTYTDALVYLPTNIGGQAQHPNFHIYDLIDCCPNDRYIQNTTYVGDYIHTAKNNIWAGDHVTNSQAYGLVIVNSGVKVKYVAKNISIQSGFYVQPGGTFKAIPTEDCVYQPVQRLMKKERYFPNEDLLQTNYSETKITKSSNSLLVYPNPSKGIYSISTAITETIENVEIFNQFGSKIQSHNKNNFNSLINLENEKNGTYFYKIIFSDGKTNTGKLIKTE